MSIKETDERAVAQRHVLVLSDGGGHVGCIGLVQAVVRVSLTGSGQEKKEKEESLRQLLLSKETEEAPGHEDGGEGDGSGESKQAGHSVTAEELTRFAFVCLKQELEHSHRVRGLIA